MTQNEVILDHLKNYGGLTSLEAIRLYQITRLAARISDLRKKGYNILSETIRKKDGKKTIKYSRYWLE